MTPALLSTMRACSKSQRATPSYLRPARFARSGAPTLKNPESQTFYAEAIRELTASGIPFLLAGTFALSAYTGVSRETKDLDIFCKPGDYPRILAHFKELGCAIAVEDDRWLGKVFKGKHFFDVIFGSANGAAA